MRFFNIDLHISVIADIKKTFTELNHVVDDKCLSEHGFVFNRPVDHVKVINNRNWKSLNTDMCNLFFREYNQELQSYDGFICTYPPSFALLYEKFNKPIILQVPIRCEVPFQNNPQMLNYFKDFLRRGIDNKQILPVANSKYDKKYCEEFTDREWHHIPNICDYTGINNTEDSKFLLYSRYPFICNHPDIILKENYLPNNHKWDIFNKVSGIIHIPYNISTMSIFEQYTGNVPLFFPTPEFLHFLSTEKYALSEISWYDNFIPSIEKLLLADYYDKEWMPHIQYFSSFKELKDMIESANTRDISNKMRNHNTYRKNNIIDLWKGVLWT